MYGTYKLYHNLQCPWGIFWWWKNFGSHCEMWTLLKAYYRYWYRHQVLLIVGDCILTHWCIILLLLCSLVVSLTHVPHLLLPIAETINRMNYTRKITLFDAWQMFLALWQASTWEENYISNDTRLPHFKHGNIYIITPII